MLATISEKSKITKNYTDSISEKEHLQLQNKIEDIRNKAISERITEKIKMFKEYWKKEEEERKKQQIYKENIRVGPIRKNTDSNFYVDKYLNNNNDMKNKAQFLKLKREKNLNELYKIKKSNVILHKGKSLNFIEKLKNSKSTPNNS